MNIKKILYKSFDSILSIREDNILKNKLLSSEKLLQKKEKIENLRIELAIMKTGKFSSAFENNVLKMIHMQDYPKMLLYKELNFAFKKLVITAILLIVFLIAFNFSEHGKVNILNKQNIKLQEAVNSEYLYISSKEMHSDESLAGDQYGL